MKLQLCYAPISCAMVSFITLTEAKADFETFVVDFRRGKHLSPEYLAINPRHKVPTLVIDGKPLAENVAIQLFVARQFPSTRLLPSDPMQEIEAISRMAWFASGVHPHLSRINLPKRFCDTPNSEASVRRLAAGFLDDDFALLDGVLEGREFFFDHFTAVDAYFFWCMRRASQYDLPLAKFAHCSAHFERMRQRASVQKVLSFEKETMERLGY